MRLGLHLGESRGSILMLECKIAEYPFRIDQSSELIINLSG